MVFYKKSIVVFVFIFLINILMTVSAYAYPWKNVRFKVRTKQLPAYCLCAGHPPPACPSQETKEKYYRIYGPIFTHMHHYCWGLDKLNIQLQSLKPSAFWLENVIHEFDYVLGHKDPKKSIKAEIFTKKAQVLLMLNKNIEAVNSFLNAIKFNKRYVPAYFYLSSYLSKIGEKNEACKILKFGIKNNPGSIILKKRMAVICQ